MADDQPYVTPQEAGYNALLQAGYSREQIEGFRLMRRIFEKGAADQHWKNKELRK